MNPYSQESQAEQEARRTEDLEILRRARQKPQPEPTTWWGERVTHTSAQDAWFGLLLFLVIIMAVALFIPGGGR